MKKYILEFLKRGLMASAGGPVILAIIYGILGATGTVTTVTPSQICVEILTSALMSFVAAGISVVYQIEHLPLLGATMIQAVVLYLDYLVIYFINGWIPQNPIGIAIFTAIYVVGYAMIWLGIYLSIRATSQRVNRKLRNI